MIVTQTIQAMVIEVICKNNVSASQKSFSYTPILVTVLLLSLHKKNFERPAIFKY